MGHTRARRRRLACGVCLLTKTATQSVCWATASDLRALLRDRGCLSPTIIGEIQRGAFCTDLLQAPRFPFLSFFWFTNAENIQRTVSIFRRSKYENDPPYRITSHSCSTAACPGRRASSNGARAPLSSAFRCWASACAIAFALPTLIPMRCGLRVVSASRWHTRLSA